jgi:Holin of 3TMs, for gene-transfer release
MALDPITAVSGMVTSIIDRIWPDPSIAATAKAELAKMQVSGEFANVVGQMEINKAEAGNPTLFVSGWRPFVGWVCGVGLVYSFIGQPLLAWGSINWHFAIPPTLDLGTLLTILGGMLGLGSLRTVEKVNGVAAK